MNLSQPTDLIQKFEGLLKWLIPYFLLFFVLRAVGIFITNDIDFTTGEGVARTSLYFTSFSLVLNIYELVLNLFIGMWLFAQSKEYDFNKYLWLLFGLVKPLVALCIFFALLLYRLIQKEV